MLQTNENSEIMLVYMDCPDCGARKEWADRQYSIAEKNKLVIKKVSFVMPEAKKLMLAAKKSGIRSMPFFTNGRKYSKDISKFIPKAKAPARKITKKKAKKNGNNSKVQG